MNPRDIPHYHQLSQVSTGQGVVVERVNPGAPPTFEAVGLVQCVSCDFDCWLTAASLRSIQNGYAPFCQQCAAMFEQLGLTTPQGMAQ